MQYNYIEGKLLVTFNGVAYTNCSSDTDCPPASAQCFLNETWAAAPAMCACLAGLAGLDCDERSLGGIGRLVSESITLIVGFPALLIGLTDFFRIVKRRFRLHHFGLPNVMEASSVLSTLALTFVILMVIYYITMMSMPRSYVRVRNGRNVRFSPLYSMSNLSILAFYFVTLSILTVTLLWLSIANDAEKVRVSKSNFILRYRALLLVYYAILGGLIIFFAVRETLEMSFYVCIPAILFVIITCALGWYKLKTQLQVFGSEQHDVLKQVGRTAGLLSVSCIFALIFAVVLSRPTVPDDVGISVCTGLFWLTAAVTQIIVMSFTHPSIVKAEKKSLSTVVTGSKFSKDSAKVGDDTAPKSTALMVNELRSVQGSESGS